MVSRIRATRKKKQAEEEQRHLGEVARPEPYQQQRREGGRRQIAPAPGGGADEGAQLDEAAHQDAERHRDQAGGEEARIDAVEAGADIGDEVLLGEQVDDLAHHQLDARQETLLLLGRHVMGDFPDGEEDDDARDPQHHGALLAELAENVEKGRARLPEDRRGSAWLGARLGLRCAPGMLRRHSCHPGARRSFRERLACIIPRPRRLPRPRSTGLRRRSRRRGPQSPPARAAGSSGAALPSSSPSTRWARRRCRRTGNRC